MATPTVYINAPPAHAGAMTQVPPPSQLQHAQQAHQLEKQRTAQKLVMLSTIFGWGGVGCLLALGPGVAIAVNGMLGAVIMGLGLISAIAGAVIGQVGRGMQGRVI